MPETESSPSWWTLTFNQVLSTCISLIGFVFVILGINTNTKTIDRSIYFEMSKLSYQTEEAFIKYPEFRPYFYEGKEIDSTDTLYARALGFSELLLDYFDTFLDMGYLEKGVKSNEGWIHWVESSFIYSPILVHTLEQDRKDYPHLYDYYNEWESNNRATTLK